MRIKIIGDNNCARAARHLLRKAGFAVTEFLPADVVTEAPHSGYAITIDLAPAAHPLHGEPRDPANKPGHSTHGQSTGNEEAPSFAKATADLPSFAKATADLPSFAKATAGLSAAASAEAGASSPTSHLVHANIHFDSVDSELEAAILRHVTQLAAAPVVVDRPGGMVHSERELRIVVPSTRDAKADEAAAVAVEFGVLRGLLDLCSPPSVSTSRNNSYGGSGKAGAPAVTPGKPRSQDGKKWWRKAFSRTVVRVTIAVLAVAGGLSAAPRRVPLSAKRLPAELAVASRARVANRAAFLPAAALSPQGQFSTGQAPVKVTDGTNTLVVDPCRGQTKLYVSINQTANAQLASGTASKKIYICSIHVVVAVATSVALVEGTGSVCATGTAGVSGFGGATAATGWNFAVNGGIALGSGDAAVGAEGTSADNLCLFSSGSGQVSGGISYVVQ
jgi:hypothetical protein